MLELKKVLESISSCCNTNFCPQVVSVLSPMVKSREFYLHDDVTLFSKWPTFGKKNRGVKFLLAASFNER